jgi:hypothetical protein
MSASITDIKESVELDEAWTADSVMKNATIGSKKGYGINIKKTGGITKTPYKHMLMTNRPDKNIRVDFDHGKEEFEGTPKSVAAYLNKILGIKESVELDKAFSDIFEKWEDNRDYKDEYAKFHSSDEARANRGARVQARRDMIKVGRAKKGDGKDVDHEVALSRGGNNDLENLRVMSPGQNRGNGRVKQTEDYGAGFEGTPEYIKKLIRDTPHAKIPHYVGSMNKKGESNGTRLSTGR